MSLVGPRPERPEFVDALHGRDRALRRPSPRQVRNHRLGAGHGLRGQTSIADRVEWDNYYIQNWSLGMDFKILALTVAEVLRYRDDA